MKFEIKNINGKKVHTINDSEVSEKAYWTLFADQNGNEPEECNECPKCSMLREIAEELIECDSVDEIFGELHELADFFEEVGYETGYREALDNQIEILQDIRKQIDKVDKEQ